MNLGTSQKHVMLGNNFLVVLPPSNLENITTDLSPFEGIRRYKINIIERKNKSTSFLCSSFEEVKIKLVDEHLGGSVG